MKKVVRFLQQENKKVDRLNCEYGLIEINILGCVVKNATVCLPYDIASRSGVTWYMLIST